MEKCGFCELDVNTFIQKYHAQYGFSNVPYETMKSGDRRLVGKRFGLTWCKVTLKSVCTSCCGDKCGHDLDCPLYNDITPDDGLPPVPQEAIEGVCNIEDVYSVFKKYLHIEEDYAIDAPFCALLGNFASGEPDIIGIVGASGSYKTEMLRTFGESENQFIYPISSLTEHTFVSGLRMNQDTVPLLRKRAVIIKDLTTLLSKKEDIRAGIFADFRELTDGYIKKEFGSGVKKEYHDIHSSIIFASTPAIERYYSMYSNLGARMLFVRPRGDPVMARLKAQDNRYILEVMREELHRVAMKFISGMTHLFETLDPPTIPDVLKQTIGEWCDFLAIARTSIHHDYKGEMDEIPVPEFPTRLFNTIMKLTQIHAIMHERDTLNDDDRSFARRIVSDNIPRDRALAMVVLKGTYETTPILAKTVGLSNGQMSRILDELTALGIVERLTREEKREGEDARSNSYRLSDRYKTIIEEHKVVIRYDVYDFQLIEQNATHVSPKDNPMMASSGICEMCNARTEVTRTIHGVICNRCLDDLDNKKG